MPYFGGLFKDLKKELELTAPSALPEAVRQGDVARARAIFDRAFWQNAPLQPDLECLKTALLREDKPMLRLLITWGAGAGKGQLQALQDHLRADEYVGEAKYALYMTLLSRCGLPQAAEEEEKKAARKKPAPNLFVNYSRDRIPEEWRRVLQALRQLDGNRQAAIAGGALRDLFNGRAVKDVDIFVESRGSTRKNRKLLQAAFQAAGLEVAGQEICTGWYGEVESVKFPTPRTTSQDWIGRLESWEVVTAPPAGSDRGTKYNIIFTSRPDPQPWTTYELISRFDFGLCQIGYDGNFLISMTPQYIHDVHKQRIAMGDDSHASKEHLERIMKKYPGWTLDAKAKKLLTQKPKPRASSGGDFY